MSVEVYCQAAECSTNEEGVCIAPAIDIQMGGPEGPMCATYAPVQPEYGAFPPGLGTNLPSNVPAPVQPPTGPGLPTQPGGAMPQGLPPQPLY